MYKYNQKKELGLFKRDTICISLSLSLCLFLSSCKMPNPKIVINGGTAASKCFDFKLAGNDFIRSLVSLMLDQEQIVGSGAFIKQVHGNKLIDEFKYPHELRVRINKEIFQIIYKGVIHKPYLYYF